MSNHDDDKIITIRAKTRHYIRLAVSLNSKLNCLTTGSVGRITTLTANV
jgi:hypothetical protein